MLYLVHMAAFQVAINSACGPMSRTGVATSFHTQNQSRPGQINTLACRKMIMYGYLSLHELETYPGCALQLTQCQQG